MDTPQFTNGQFVDQILLNAAAGNHKSSLMEHGAELNTPGLIQPGLLTLVPTLNTIAVTAPSPFSVMFASGVLAKAHGTTDGADTNSITLNFAPLIPGSSSVTAYIIASAATVQASPYADTGPPVGHPDFNPNFVPFTAYSDVKDTLSITASTTAPDNLTTFELGRTTLVAGQTSITTIDTSHQVYASSVLNPLVNSGSYPGGAAALGLGADGRATSATATFATDTGAVNAMAVTLTPGPANLAALVGVPLVISIGHTNTSSASTLNANSFGAISVINPDSTAVGVGQLVAGSLGVFVYDGVHFQIISVSNSKGRLINVQIFTSSNTYTPTAGTNSIIGELCGGGGGGGGSPTTGAGQVGGGGGGAGGGYSRKRMTSGFSGQGITIGAGGLGVLGGSIAGTGGTSSFGAIFSATGGQGGQGTVSSTPSAFGGETGAGVGIGGDVNIAGGYGKYAILLGAAASVSGEGGASYFGPGATPVNNTSSGTAALNPGGGGSGALLQPSSGGPATGGNGAPGICIIYEYS